MGTAHLISAGNTMRNNLRKTEHRALSNHATLGSTGDSKSNTGNGEGDNRELEYEASFLFKGLDIDIEEDILIRDLWLYISNIRQNCISDYENIDYTYFPDKHVIKFTITIVADTLHKNYSSRYSQWQDRYDENIEQFLTEHLKGAAEHAQDADRREQYKKTVIVPFENSHVYYYENGERIQYSKY